MRTLLLLALNAAAWTLASRLFRIEAGVLVATDAVRVRPSFALGGE